MFISCSLLKDSLERYQKLKLKPKEKFSTAEVAAGGTSAAFTSFILVVAVVFFILEIILLFYAINMALACSQSGAERVVNVVLAIIFTVPYVLLNILFNKCAKKSLVNLGK